MDFGSKFSVPVKNVADSDKRTCCCIRVVLLLLHAGKVLNVRSCERLERKCRNHAENIAKIGTLFEESQEDQNWLCFHQETSISFGTSLCHTLRSSCVLSVIFQLKFLEALHTSITACHEAYHGASLFSLGSAVAFDRALEICNESTCMLKMTRGLYIMVAAPKHDLSFSIICAVILLYLNIYICNIFYCKKKGAWCSKPHNYVLRI